MQKIFDSDRDIVDNIIFLYIYIYIFDFCIKK